MGMENLFEKKYIKKVLKIVKKTHPDIPEDEVVDIIKRLIEEQGQDPRVMLDNNYTGEQRETSLTAVLNWIINEEPIIAGNGTFYKNQHIAMNPIAMMLKNFLSNRKKFKSMLFNIEDQSSYKYIEYDRMQLNEKRNANSYYGGSGAPSSPFYSKWSGPATTLTAQSVIATAEQFFEGFLADNYLYLDVTECLEWCEAMIKQWDDDKLDVWVEKVSIDSVVERLSEKIINCEDSDTEIIRSYLSVLDDATITSIYYRNNLIEFMDKHQYIKDMIISIFDGCEQFMDPNDPPKEIREMLKVFNDSIVKYVYPRYLSFDRVYRIKNFKRRTVTVIDTDSNILSLDFLINFIFDDVLANTKYTIDDNDSIFKCVNTIAYLLSTEIADMLLFYGKHSNIPEEFRPLFGMKNEFFMKKLIIAATKKRYISQMLLREGHLLNPPKFDVKGFDFKKSTTSEYAEKVYSKIIENRILNSDTLDVVGMSKDIADFRKELEDSIRSGDSKYLPILSAKEWGAYKNPTSMQSVKASTAWNIIYPDNMIEYPAKISSLKLNIFKEEDIEDLKDKEPEIYNTIIEKIFNDTTGLYVQKTWDPGIDYVSPKDKEWYTKIPSKYRTKYKKLGALKWNEFVDEYSNTGATDSGKWVYKKIGLQNIGIPLNTDIPEWLQPYIDIDSIINNITEPFVPVLEIFKIRTITVGKSSNGRKTNKISNIIKF